MKLGLKIIIGVLGGILVTLGLVVVILFGVAVTQGGKYDKTSKEFVDTSIPKIISEWDYATFCKYSHDDMPLTVSQKDFDDKFVFPIKTQLGKFISYDSSDGEAIINSTNGKTTIKAEYASEVTFEKATAVITTQLLYINNNWVITNLNIQSDKLVFTN
jgi:hypothetical protein